MIKTKRRFIAFLVLTMILTFLVIFQYASIMLFNEDAGGIASDPIVERGPILDRNGEILAIQNRLYTVEAWKPSITQPRETARILAETLGIQEDILYRTFTAESGSSFLYVQRKISPQQTNQLSEYMEQGKLRGITLRPEFSRNYPEGNLASHLIGFVDIDSEGLAGVEYTYNDRLMPERSASSDRELFGAQVFLTIDKNLQYIVEEIAERALEENVAESVQIHVMNAKNAEIHAYAALPSFDPAHIGESSLESRRNRPIDMTFEPGSVFKIFSIASLLNLGGITEDSTFVCDGSYNHELSSGEEIVIGCQGVHGEVTPELILYHSCNAGAAYASETVDEALFYEQLTTLGFGRRTGIALSGESAGILNPPEFWSARTKPTISFGQEIAVSAVQMLTAATAVANHGVLLEPHIIRKVVAADGTVLEEIQPTAVRQALRPEIADSVLEMLQTVTSPGGGAWRAATEGISIAAKTGTAEIADPETGTYSDEDFISSCLAFVPAEDPQWIIYAVIEKPKGESYWGGTIAAPLIRELVEKMAVTEDIPVAGQTEILYPNQIILSAPETYELSDSMPDFTGASKRQLLPLLARTDLEIRIEGEGWVVEQSPLPGTPYTSGMEIWLRLE